MDKERKYRTNTIPPYGHIPPYMHIPRIGTFTRLPQ